MGRAPRGVKEVAMPSIRDLSEQSDAEFLAWLADHLDAPRYSQHHGRYIRSRLIDLAARGTLPIVGRF